MGISRRAVFAGLMITALSVTGFALHESPPTQSARPKIRSPFILDPGHGGQDLGAVVAGKREKDIALAIARKVKERLEKPGGAPARLTRDSDVFLGLDERVDQSLEWNGAAFISLHLNKVRYRGLEGITVYAFGRDRLSPDRGRRRRGLAPLPPPPRAQARASAALAESIARALRAQGLRVGPPERASFYVLKNPGIPSVLIELGYLSNPQEAARLGDPSYQDRLAEALAASLSSYSVDSGPAPVALAAKAR